MTCFGASPLHCSLLKPPSVVSFFRGKWWGWVTILWLAGLWVLGSAPAWAQNKKTGKPWGQSKPPMLNIPSKSTSLSRTRRLSFPSVSLRPRNRRLLRRPTNTPVIPPLRMRSRDRQWAKALGKVMGEGRRLVALLDTDNVLYRPGDTLWGQATELWVRGNRLPNKEQRAMLRLLDQRGNVWQQMVLSVKKGQAQFALFLPQNVPSGQYILRYVNLFSGVSQQVSLWVKAGQSASPGLSVRWSKPSYRLGDTANVWLGLSAPKGKVSRHPVQLMLRLGKRVLRRWSRRLGAGGQLWFSFRLPRTLKKNTMFVMATTWNKRAVEVSRPVPIQASQLKVRFFPEGGQALEDAPSRVYVSSFLEPSFRPVSIGGWVEDDNGKFVTRYNTYFQGLGRLVYKPAEGREYRLRVTQPAEFAGVYPLPSVEDEGVSIQVRDDFASSSRTLGVTVHSSKARKVVVAALHQERLVAHQMFALKEGKQFLRIRLAPHGRGILRLTLFDAMYKTPLAERLVFRYPRGGLHVQVQTLQQHPVLRSKVKVGVRVLDAKGRPVPKARVTLAVTKQSKVVPLSPARWIAQRFLHSSELQGRVFRASSYFDPDEPRALKGLDLVMGVHGWRGWNWNLLQTRKPPKALRSVDELRAEATLKKKWPVVRLAPVEKPFAWANRAPWDVGVFSVSPFGPSQIKALRRSRLADPDGDGLPRGVDVCPFQPGSLLGRGCPLPDHDNDGWPDTFDACPYVSGASAFRDCPQPKAQKVKRQFIKVSAKVFFSAGSASPDKESKVVLQNTLQLLKLYPGLSLSLEGHTNEAEAKGSKAFALGLQRAKKVRKWLEGKGVPRSRLLIKSYGERRPLTRIPSKVLQAKNRRVSIQVASYMPLPWWFRVKKARVFPARTYASEWKDQQVDWRSTLYWNPSIKTNSRGVATVSFFVGDRTGSFVVRATALGRGQLGQGDNTFRAVKPIRIKVEAPKQLVYSDAVNVPVYVFNRSKHTLRVLWKATFGKALKWGKNKPKRTFVLKPWSRYEMYLPLRVTEAFGFASLRVVAYAQGKGWRVSKEVRIPLSPLGYPKARAMANLLQPSQATVVKPQLPQDWRSKFVEATWTLFPSLLSQLHWSLKQRRRRVLGSLNSLMAVSFPHLFVVGSLVHYPGMSPRRLWLSYQALYAARRQWLRCQKTSGALAWYPGGRASVLATASGVLLGLALSAVHPLPKVAMKRAVRWLWRRRKRWDKWQGPRNWDVLKPAERATRKAYLAYVLAVAGKKKLKPQLQWLKTHVDSFRDPYLWSLSLLAWVAVYGPSDPQATKWSRLLFQNRRTDGGFYGTQSSVDGATGRELHIQTTSWALKALVRSNMPPVVLLPTIRWLHQQRQSDGFGSERTAMLALHALYVFQQKTKREESAGLVTLSLKNKVIARGSYLKEQGQTLVLKGWSKALRSRLQFFQMMLRSGHRVPYLMAWRSTTLEADSHPRAPLLFDLSVSSVTWRVGLYVPMNIKVVHRSRSKPVVPVVKLRLPGGLRAKEWRLKALVRRGVLRWFQIRGGEVTLVLPPLSPRQSATLTILCEAFVPGHFSSQPSMVFPASNPELATWGEPIQLIVRP
ncbi:MAG: hypothetical protein EP343_26550 [Deltaproteobacteria bacterium]|nr:MAG: hypothetical protein EP343_26550 [Deltaproteobacteria bacterium]